MPRRPQARDWTGGRTRTKDRAALVAVIAAIVIFVAAGVYLARLGNARHVPVDPVTMCPTETHPTAATVILLDTSDPLTERQRLKLATELTKIHRGIARLGL